METDEAEQLASKAGRTCSIEVCLEGVAQLTGKEESSAASVGRERHRVTDILPRGHFTTCCAVSSGTLCQRCQEGRSIANNTPHWPALLTLHASSCDASPKVSQWSHVWGHGVGLARVHGAGPLALVRRA